MTFYKALLIAGVTLAILGLLILTFQATIYLIFGLWYGFSALEILQHLRLQDYIVTNLPGFNDTVAMLLGIPLAVVLIVVGGLLGLIGFHAVREEIKWSPPQ